MKKHFFFLPFLLTVQLSFGQEKVFEITDAFSEKFLTYKESYAIPNEENKNLLILTEEDFKLSAYLLDSQYGPKAKIETKALPPRYKNLIGYDIRDNLYSVFFTNSRNTKFGVLQFDINKQTATQRILNFKLKKEKYIESVIYKNKIYLLSITKRSSDLNIYTFNDSFTAEKKVISLNSVEYPSELTQGITRKVYNMLTAGSTDIFNPTVNIAKIESRNPNVIETTSKKIKLYRSDNEIAISFDNSVKETKVCFINLDTYELTYKSYDQPAKTEQGFAKSNSYIFDNKLFQISSSRQKMKFRVSDIETKEIIKEYRLNKEDTIDFKNSPILQEGGGMFPSITSNRVREMEKTAKYLRKITAADLGISVYKLGNQYNIVLGGTKEINGGGAMTIGFGGAVGGAVAGFGNITVGFNPTFYGYNGYSTSKSTYINCLFDENFDHLEGDIQKNKYDIINDFEDTLSENIEAVNVFLHDNQIHYSFADPKDHSYQLYRFKE
ncbi:hypothetical protein ACWGOQ_0000885 [Aquimarina sp. M1]